MKKATKKGNSKKKRGRPSTGRDPVVAIRLPTTLTERVDAWAEKNGCSRSEAIRQLVEKSLHVRKSARDLAGDQIDKLSDASASEEERVGRKRRLTKGPEEFRELRKDQPRKK